jgi:N-acyl-D-aspartate/D-glutamate deacylase
MITNCAMHRDYQGKTLEEIARAQNRSPVDVYIEVVKDGGASVVCRSMKESDIENFYKQPWVMVASDGGIGMPHPRGAGTYPRVLGRFVREKHWLTLEEAIRKMTQLPAARLGIKDRGMLRAGMKADIVLFDAATVIDHSTMTSPFVEPTGIAYVFVNGIGVVEDGKVTGALPGAVLRHQARVDSKEKLTLSH